MDELKLDIKRQIDAYVKGTLGEEEIEALWIQLAKNPSLLDQLEIEVGTRELLTKNSHKNERKNPAPTVFPSWIWHAAAAAVICLAVGLQLFHVPSKSDLNEFTISEIGPEQMETSNGTRSIKPGEFDVDSVLNLGFRQMVEGDSDNALIQFNLVIEKGDYPPYGGKAYFNKGIILYNQNQYESSTIALEEALSRIDENHMLEEKLYWFLGNAYARAGKLEKAQETIYTVYLYDGVFRFQAFELLQKLNFDLGYFDDSSADSLTQ